VKCGVNFQEVLKLNCAENKYSKIKGDPTISLTGLNRPDTGKDVAL